MDDKTLNSTALITALLVMTAIGLTVGKMLLETGSTSAVEAPEVLTTVYKPEVVRSGAGELKGTGQVAIAVIDQTIRVVEVECGPFKQTVGVNRGVAIVSSIPRSDCTVRLQDTEGSYGTIFPGDHLSCRAIDGDTQCKGGQAQKRSATVAVRATGSASLEVDGVGIGPLPVDDLKLTVGSHNVSVIYATGKRLEWELNVNPDEKLTVTFE